MEQFICLKDAQKLMKPMNFKKIFYILLDLITIIFKFSLFLNSLHFKFSCILSINMRSKSWMHNNYWIFFTIVSRGRMLLNLVEISYISCPQTNSNWKIWVISTHRHIDWVFCGVYNNIFIIRIKSIWASEQEYCLSKTSNALINAVWADVSAALLHLMFALRMCRLDLASEECFVFC